MKNLIVRLLIAVSLWGVSATVLAANEPAPGPDVSQLNKINYDGVLCVVGLVSVKADRVEDFKKLLPPLARDIGKEDGSIVVAFSQSLEDPTRFTFYGEWGSKASFIEHIDLPHSLKFRTAVADMMADAPKFTYHKRVRL